MCLRSVIVLALAALASAIGLCASQAPHESPGHHLADVNRRGDTAMGFSHIKATHHFRLSPTGGSIQVQAHDPKDSISLSHIRMHLQHTAKAFKNGDFSDPQLTHGRVPPGVTTMRRLKSEITYNYEETGAGARILITTANPEALKAVHNFLRFQIDDHQTGDSRKVR